MGFMAAKHLFVASEVGLFEALAAGPATIDELARRTEVPSRTIAITTAAMVGLGLIEQHGDRYQNGEPAAAFLAGKRGLDLRPMLRFFDQMLSDVAKACGRGANRQWPSAIRQIR
jgi:DNA-binding IclR family transcriptional regulator